MRSKTVFAFLVLMVTPTCLLAARPSINDLNTRVNKLEADVNQLDSRVTTNESDINANCTLIDDNTNRINALRPSVSVRADGVRIGTYLTTIEDASSGVPRDVMVMNDDEHLFRICIATGECGNKLEGELMPPEQRRFGDIIAYTSTDCSGQGYLLEQQLETISGLGSLLKGSGYVFNTGGGIYYLPINSQPIEDKGSVTVRAVRFVDSFLCNPPGTYPRGLLYPVFPNDPAVTGVSTSSFALPLSLGF